MSYCSPFVETVLLYYTDVNEIRLFVKSRRFFLFHVYLELPLGMIFMVQVVFRFIKLESLSHCIGILWKALSLATLIR